MEVSTASIPGIRDQATLERADMIELVEKRNPEEAAAAMARHKETAKRAYREHYRALAESEQNPKTTSAKRGRMDSSIWSFDARDGFRSEPATGRITLDAERSTPGEMPAKLHGPGQHGCHSVALKSRLDQGVYRLTLGLREPTARVGFRVLVDGRMVATNAAYKLHD